MTYLEHLLRAMRVCVDRRVGCGTGVLRRSGCLHGDVVVKVGYSVLYGCWCYMILMCCSLCGLDWRVVAKTE